MRSVGAIGALGAAAMVPGATRLAAQADAGKGSMGPRRIDVHEHMFAPAYKRAAKMGVAQSASTKRRASPLVSHWTPEGAIEEMEKNGVATAVVSIPVSGISFNEPGEASRALARGNNEYGAQLVRDYPGHFGFFASLPFADREGSLKEIEYSLDTLHADGIALMTNYGTRWPGDAIYDPIYEELNRRKAVVFVHPTTPACCGELIPGVSPAWEEFDFDTARAGTSLLVNHTFEKFPDIQFILTHCGGALPVESARIQDYITPGVFGKKPGTAESYFSKVFYDIAAGANPMALAALTQLVDTSHILFGTDFPFVRMDTTVDGYLQWGFSSEERRQINRENALGLLPRLKAHA
ncbi:MAG TPA: amidohydrolase family protein [Patescibacteria group bacterium]|nr:amidohydrolase family protein [Patescibacteria group bacterium]